MEIGERIKKLRLEHHLTQEQLGEILGVQKSAIAKYENGRVENLKRATIQKMAEFFEVSPLLFLEDAYTAKRIIAADIVQIPLYSSVSCGTGMFVDDHIEDYITVPDRYLKRGREYFANIASGDSMIGRGIKDGDVLVFEKTNIVENGQIGCFCVDENEAVCKTFRKLGSGLVLLESANEKYSPIEIDFLKNECFKILGLYKFKLSIEQ